MKKVISQEHPTVTTSHIDISLSEERNDKVLKKKEKVQELINEMAKIKIIPDQLVTPDGNPVTAQSADRIPLHKLIKRPEINILSVSKYDDKLNNLVSNYNTEEIEQAEIQLKYESYIEKEKVMVGKLQSLEDHKIPDNFDYMKVQALSAEGKEKLIRLRPETLGRASRISGVSASDISILMIYLRK